MNPRMLQTIDISKTTYEGPLDDDDSLTFGSYSTGMEHLKIGYVHEKPEPIPIIRQEESRYTHQFSSHIYLFCSQLINNVHNAPSGYKGIIILSLTLFVGSVTVLLSYVAMGGFTVATPTIILNSDVNIVDVINTSESISSSPSIYPTINPSKSSFDDNQIDIKSPSFLPTVTPTTIEQSLTHTTSNTESPTNSPTFDPTLFPTSDPLSLSTNELIPILTNTPTFSPTKALSMNPSLIQTNGPTISSIHIPAAQFTDWPTLFPTRIPTIDPTMNPTIFLSERPSTFPTFYLSTKPTVQPTEEPTESPRIKETSNPTQNPTSKPTASPTIKKTNKPTQNPTAMPTAKATAKPTKNPTSKPTAKPTKNPTSKPTASPTIKKTNKPTKNPTSKPTAKPTKKPIEPVDVVFYVTGNTPYTFDDGVILHDQIENLPTDGLFLMHLGAIDTNMETVDDDYYYQCQDWVYTETRDLLLQSKTPVFIIPGDSDYYHCPDPNIAMSHWLNSFDSFEKNWNNLNLSVTRSSQKPVYFSFIESEVLFIGIQLNGGPIVISQEEWDELITDNVKWVIRMVQKSRDDVKSVVIFGYAKVTSALHQPFIEILSAACQSWQLPILYVHTGGDGESFSVQRGDEANLFDCEYMTDVQINKGSISPPLQVSIENNKEERFFFQ